MDRFDVDDLGCSPKLSVSVVSRPSGLNILEHLEETEPQTEFALESDRDVRKDEKAAICDRVSVCHEIDEVMYLPLLSTSLSL